MGDVIAFQSASFPAQRAGDPDASEAEAAGVACLEYILDAIGSHGIRIQGGPPSAVAEDSGCSGIVELEQARVVIHLEWFPAGPPRGQQRDVWTLQVWPSGSLRRALPSHRLRGDDVANAVADVLERVLRGLPGEFSEVQRCTWADLER